LTQPLEIFTNEEKQFIIVLLQQLGNEDQTAQIPAKIVESSSGILSELKARA
jgi:hypothetical protein